MKRYLFGFTLSLLMVTHAFAWEITTHQQLTKMALEGEKAANLDFFVKIFELGNEDYSDRGNVTLFIDDTEPQMKNSDQVLIDDVEYPINYLVIHEANGGYIKVAKELTSWNKKLGCNIEFEKGNYAGMIEAGSILEDMGMKRGFGYTFYTNARFARHFYDPHKSGCYGLKGKAMCAKEWAYTGDDESNINKFSWRNAYKYYFDSILEHSARERKTAQANLFASIGFLSHLLQDMTAPAHARNDFHGIKDELETWANYNFNAKKRVITLADQKDVNLKNFSDFFTATATFTHNNFFSDDTVPRHLKDEEEINSATREGEIVDYSKPHRYYSHNSPKLENITEENVSGDLYQILSKGLQVPDGTKLGFSYRSNFKKFREKFSLLLNDSSYQPQPVLEEYAKILLPRAISATRGLVNFFFRARISASIDKDDPDKLSVKNITKQGVVSTDADVTIMTGAIVHIYYETVDGSRLPLPGVNGYIIQKKLANDESVTIKGLSSAIEKVSSLDSSERIDEKNTIIVVIDGFMGDGADMARTIAATKFTKPITPATKVGGDIFSVKYELDGNADALGECELSLNMGEPDGGRMSSSHLRSTFPRTINLEGIYGHISILEKNKIRYDVDHYKDGDGHNIFQPKDKDHTVNIWAQPGIHCAWNKCDSTNKEKVANAILTISFIGVIKKFNVEINRGALNCGSHSYTMLIRFFNENDKLTFKIEDEEHFPLFYSFPVTPIK